ncbi:hypothetical protein OJAV_G00084000 [Oryzias javanicus]|uniref:Uncharacterized protein n=1 Tax=Oryzias javanicus TaxID=123683 RepID=A0A437D5P2_ORYJA|nr:hypothetical protein OJAV_G00084000 [Oryzias javanicus]
MEATPSQTSPPASDLMLELHQQEGRGSTARGERAPPGGQRAPPANPGFRRSREVCGSGIVERFLRLVSAAILARLPPGRRSAAGFLRSFLRHGGRSSTELHRQH